MSGKLDGDISGLTADPRVAQAVQDHDEGKIGYIRLIRAVRDATLASLLPTEAVLEQAAKAGCEAVGWNPDSPMMTRFLRAASVVLLADKEREIELLRIERNASWARVDGAESRVAALEGALGPDLAGRSFADLLDQVALVTEAMGGGPMTDCLKDKAVRIRTLLDGGTR